MTQMSPSILRGSFSMFFPFYSSEFLCCCLFRSISSIQYFLLSKHISSRCIKVYCREYTREIRVVGINFFSCFCVDFTSGMWYQVESDSPICKSAYRYSFRVEEYTAILHQRHLSITFFVVDLQNEKWGTKWG